jgi:hypothetical protein
MQVLVEFHLPVLVHLDMDGSLALKNCVLVGIDSLVVPTERKENIAS